MTRTVPDREATADRLLASSARNSFDPDIDVDWAAPFADGKYFMPPERMSLYGTPLWDRLTETQRIELSKHEMASIMSVGLWFEICLMQMLVRYAYDLDPRSAHAQYALTEVGDETRHAVMFARTADTLGVPAYGVPRALHQAARLFKATTRGPAMFASVLVAEETTDRLQRAMMDDDRIQPLIRTVNRIHVVEEARHVRYAREELARTAPRLSRANLARHRFITAQVAYQVVTALVDPHIYLSVGIPPAQGRAVASANPHFHTTRRWMAEKLVPFLRTTRMIAPTPHPLWQKSHLL